ncbi:MAG: family 20 glycosylhydrolase [Bacillota bacterium]|nr:family 20 glycosylhydrolase [Bacillota bacterium]
MEVVPKPKKIVKKGEINIKQEISCCPELEFTKKAFCRMVRKIYGVRLSFGTDGILVNYDETLKKDEYRLEGRNIYASSIEGASYGLSTMLQIMEKSDDGFKVQDTEIFDKPDKDFRGFMEDLARVWHDFDNLIGYVDICYLNKIKYLQLHFSDNQSFTLPLECFPEAATKGRCYTKEEIRYLVEYAHEANIILIPEFEGIGHSKELIKNCPEFGNTYDIKNEEQEDKTFDGSEDNIMCIGKEGIFNNIRKILQEIADTFKYSPYIHVGCDEAKIDNWKNCSCCMDYMKRQQIKDVKNLYSHFVQKIVDICLSLGRTPIVWEGFPYEGTDKISKDAIVVSWESYYQTAPELLSSGFKIINASWKPLYIVPPQHTQCLWSIPGADWNVYNWQHFAKASKAYNPINVEPQDNVLGGMLCQWECSLTEEKDRVIYNMPALSDRCWNTEDFLNEEDYEKSSKKLLSMAQKLI